MTLIFKLCGTVSSSLCALMMVASMLAAPGAAFGQEPTDTTLFNCGACNCTNINMVCPDDTYKQCKDGTCECSGMNACDNK